MAARPFFEHPLTIRFQDIDAAGILFFARVFDLFNDTQMACVEALGLSVPQALRDGTWGFPLVHAEADYRAPMRFGDRVIVTVESVTLGTTSMTWCYRVRDGERTLATGKTVHAFVDMKAFVSIAVPDDIRMALKDGKVV